MLMSNRSRQATKRLSARGGASDPAASVRPEPPWASWAYWLSEVSLPRGGGRGVNPPDRRNPAGQASHPPASTGNVAGGSSTFGVLDLLPECPLTTGEEWSRKVVRGSASLRTSRQVFTFETTTSALRHRADGPWEWQVGVDVGLNPESPSAAPLLVVLQGFGRRQPLRPHLPEPVRAGPDSTRGSGQALVGFQLPDQPATDVFLLLQNAGGQNGSRSHPDQSRGPSENRSSPALAGASA